MKVGNKVGITSVGVGEKVGKAEDGTYVGSGVTRMLVRKWVSQPASWMWFERERRSVHQVQCDNQISKGGIRLLTTH